MIVEGVPFVENADYTENQVPEFPGMVGQPCIYRYYDNDTGMSVLRTGIVGGYTFYANHLYYTLADEETMQPLEASHNSIYPR